MTTEEKLTDLWNRGFKDIVIMYVGPNREFPYYCKAFPTHDSYGHIGYHCNGNSIEEVVDYVYVAAEKTNFKIKNVETV